MQYIILSAVLLVWLVLSWFAGTWLNVHGAGLWILRGGLALVGIAAVAIYLWWERKNRDAIAPGSGGVLGDEVDARVHEARAKLRAISRNNRSDFGDYPLVFVMGESGSTKTTILRNSGLDPELLSGIIDGSSGTIPTSSANLLYTRQAIFVDAGGALLNNSEALMRLVERVQPSKVGSAVKNKEAAPRMALVCVDVETFLTRDGQANTAAARKINAALQNISQHMGIDFAVYVVFTRTDRLTGFTEYVRNFNMEEGSQVLGATVPLKTTQVGGVYADEATRRLGTAFDELFYSLADRRMDVISRESEIAKHREIFEFPRELRKLRAPLLQFLVDLGRPSQLPTNPFLRGFYFVGVRPVIVNESAPAAATPEANAPAGAVGATRMFDMRQAQAAAAAPAPKAMSSTRKVPHWAFAAQLFTRVILRDKSAMAASSHSTQVSFVRRVLLASASLLMIAVAIAFVISYAQNHSLASEIATTAASIPHAVAGQVPTTTDLQKLDIIRQDVERLRQYEQSGAPWSMRWGLYSGNTLLPRARAVYFEKFRELLLADTQAHLVATMQKLPSVPDPAMDYQSTYSTLKAYLVTTNNADKSVRDFLSPVLTGAYVAGRQVEADRVALISKQFDFYADELRLGNPYSGTADDAVVTHARAYLHNFAGEERVYQSLLSQAGSKNAAIDFNRNFPNAANVVSARYVVPGAFTKGGFAFMQDAIRKLDQYLHAEDWVLGQSGAPAADVAVMQGSLKQRYTNEFVNHWRSFARSAAFQPYRSLPDAATKLGTLSNPTSPILEFVSTISENTNVDDANIKNIFQSAQLVVPPGSNDRYVQPANQPYMTAISNAQSAVAAINALPNGANDPNAVAQTVNVATAGQGAVRQMAQAFVPDKDGHTEAAVQRLLDEPFSAVINVLKGASVAEINGGGAAFCSQFRQIIGKAPFNPNAKDEATMDEFNKVFAPSGAFWSFYTAKLQNVLQKQGSTYVASTTGAVHITPEYQRFFNTVAAFSESIYPGGSPQPKLTYKLRQSPRNTVDGLSVSIDGVTLSGPGTQQQFTWPGTGQGVALKAKDALLPSYEGTWGVFRFMSSFNWTSNTEIEQTLRLGNQIIKNADGTPKVVRYEIEMANPAVFRTRLAGVQCVSSVAR